MMAAGQAGHARSDDTSGNPAACALYLEDHAAYSDGFLSDDEMAAHEAHAAECASCARYARVLARGLELVRELPEIEPSPYFEQRLQHRIFHIEDEKHLERSTGRSGAGLAAAAVIGLIAWSPVLWNSDMVASARASIGGSGYDTPTTQLAVDARNDARGRYERAWYVQPASPEIEQTAVHHVVSNTGSYSPLIVSPPAYGRGPRAVRLAAAVTE